MERVTYKSISRKCIGLMLFCTLLIVSNNTAEGVSTHTEMNMIRGVPVLTYHHILKASENKLFRNAETITPEEFKWQMKFLHDNGFTTITPYQLLQYLRGKTKLPSKSVLITFDDGYQSIYKYAYPVLREYGFKATEFLITSHITNKPQKFDPAKLSSFSRVEMKESSDVFGFESHTHNLHKLDKDKKCLVISSPEKVVKADIAESKKLIRANYFAYPYGQYNMTTIKILKELGFKMAFTTSHGYVTCWSDPFRVKRFSIRPETTLQDFKAILGLSKNA
jgi:peptidoglycan/xylan/chitin deacetylase (PgdA/CDA1 family)